MSVKVDFDKCTGCGTCKDVCPIKAIELSNDKAKVREEACVECGTCVEACPEGALSQEEHSYVKEVISMLQGDGTGLIARSGGRGRMRGTRPGAGPGGACVCPSCGTTLPHHVGVPCYHLECPHCASAMVRK